MAEQLIDWSRVPDDPLFRLVFPQREMLDPEDFAAMADLLRKRSSAVEISALANRIRAGLNPHPADQVRLNSPELDGRTLDGVQHKYDETVLYFPARGQVCHSYCTFCFRWAQFIGDRSLRFASSRPDLLARYLRKNPQVSDLLVTGGDPMVMLAHHLESYVQPLIAPELEHVQTIRIGTKSLTFWPQRYVTDPDASELLRLFERWVRAGKHVAIMAHYNHWRELDTPIAREAIRKIRGTGATIRSQGPLLRRINDDSNVWSRLWNEQGAPRDRPLLHVRRARHRSEAVLRSAARTRLGDLPRRDEAGLGPRQNGARAVDEHESGQGRNPGRQRGLRGESLRAAVHPGPQTPTGCSVRSNARFNERATWLDELKPAFGAPEFFFEPEFRQMAT